MRRHPTATSAGSDTSQAASLGSDRRAVATRGASSTSTGSGASSGRGRLALLLIAVAAFALFALAPLAQAKVVVNGFGFSGTDKKPGGSFTNIGGLAINQTGAGGVPAGTVYVGDSTSRIERFSAEGAFERMWGEGVGGAGVNVCTVAASCQLGTQAATTGNGDQVGSTNRGPAINQTNGHVFVADGTNFRVTEFDANGTFIRTWGWDVISTGKPNNVGTANFEVCDTTKGNVKADCKRGVTGTNPGQFSSGIGFPTVDASGNIWVTESSALAVGQRRIQEFDPSGNWMRTVGGDVITNGAEGTGTLSTGTKNVTNVVMAKKYFEVGQKITGAGIPAGTTITAVGTFLDAATSTLTISNNATESGAKVLTAPEGTGNKPTNETQTVTVNPVGASGFFALQFAGGITGGFGTGGAATANSPTLTGVKLTQGTLKVGQAATARNSFGEALPEGSTITKIEGSPENSTITFSKDFASPTTGLEVIGYELPYNATAAEVQTQLNALPQIGAAGGSVSVTGPVSGPYQVTFAGTRFSGADVPSMVARVTALQPAIAARTGVVTSSQPNALESCAVAADCRLPSPGTAPGQFGTINLDPEQPMFDSAGFLYTTDRENNRTQRFDLTNTTASVFASGTTLAPYTAEAPYRQAIGSNGNRLLFAVNNKVSANEVQIIETDLTGAVKDTSLVGSKVPASGQVPVGLAENFSTGMIYLATQNGATNPAPRKVLMLNTTPPPATVQALDPITVKDDVSATFTGTVDPTGGLVSCQFEYSTDQTVWTVVKETACNDMAQNGGAQPVTESIKEIVPNTKYFVRLSVSRAMIPNSAVLTPVREFNTDAPLPVVTRTSAINITDTSVRIATQIDPRHNDTEWIVEYGTTPGLGQETAPLDIGEGGPKSVPVVASQVIEGLAPGITYYYKVKATNSTGPSSSALQSFKTRTEPLPPGADRKYEQVSPVDKNSNNIDAINRGFGLQSTISLDGEAISFCSGSIFGNPAPAYNGLFSCYDAQREAGGWFTKGTIPNYCARDVNAETGTGGGAGTARWYSRYVDHSIFQRPEGGSCSLPILDPAAPNQPGANIYRGDLQSSPTTYDLLAPEPHFVEKGGELTDPSYNTSGVGEIIGGNDDYSRVFYTSNGQQTSDALPASKLQQLYEWNDEDGVNLVSVKPDGSPFTAQTGAVRLAQAYHGISANGDRMMFASPVPTHAFFTSTPEAGEDRFYLCATNDCQIYMREDQSDTYEVSKSECTIAPCPLPNKYAAFFLYATNDTSKSWFTTDAKLTNDDTTTIGQDLYMYTQSANPDTDKNLTFLSKDNEPADGTEAKVQAVLGTSADGNTVYFAGRGQLIAGQTIKSGFKVYKWEYNSGSPTIQMVVNLPPNEFEQALNWFRMIPNEHTLHREGEYSEFGGPAGSEYGHLNVAENVNVSADGKYLLLMSVSQLVESADYDKYVDMYRWSADEGLVCVTCQALGEASKGDSFVEPPTQNGAAGGSLTQQYVMSADGKRVFFQTPDPLLPEDENTRAVQREAYKGEDVYEWNDGTLRLISTGRSSDYSYLLGITPDARDVFFVTTQPLVGWDIDPNSDIYDARIDGGFPEPKPEPAECEGEACRSGGSTPPTPTPAGTAVFDGPANKEEIGVCEPGTRKAQEKGKTVCKPKKKKKHHKKKHHKKKAQSKKRDANNNRRTAR